MSVNQEIIGERIRTLRLMRGLSRESLAESIGVSDDHMKKIENGQRTASIDVYINCADYFDVSLDYLLRGQEGKNQAVKTVLMHVIQILTTLLKEL